MSKARSALCNAPPLESQPRAARGPSASVPHHVVEQSRRWTSRDRQAIGIFILRDRVGGAPAVDAVGRTRVVAEPGARDLRGIGEIGSALGYVPTREGRL